MKTYNYAIVKENYPALKKESTFLDNNYKPTKYALIEKQCFVDGSEGINRIVYSDDLAQLSIQAKTYLSWYNYPIGVCKGIQGYITEC